MSNLLSALALSAPHAYIDPSTGGMLFQVLAVLLAVGSGILFFFSRQIKSVVARLRRSRREEDEPKPADDSK
jgi:hypothetical protein